MTCFLVPALAAAAAAAAAHLQAAVSEDFAASDVSITTRDPGPAVLANGNSLHVVIGGRAADLLETEAGGIACFGRFGDPTAGPW
jgi:hypothetical protein